MREDLYFKGKLQMNFLDIDKGHYENRERAKN